VIVIVCGPPAVGKTTITNRVHERLAAAGTDFETVRSDEFSRHTYEQMYERVAESGTDWLLDGTFYKPEVG
jgi:deoxyadenosine/deoxycytidine kinase